MPMYRALLYYRLEWLNKNFKKKKNGQKKCRKKVFFHCIYLMLLFDIINKSALRVETNTLYQRYKQCIIFDKPIIALLIILLIYVIQNFSDLYYHKR
jgi:hypothetical protein